MKVEHLEIIVEEPSMEAFLRALLPKMLADKATFQVYPHQCKEDLLGHLSARLKGYASWLPDTWRILVIVDRDDDDCRQLKERMERMATEAGLCTRTGASNSSWGRQVVNRVAIEELEAWYFSDWEAVRKVYPRVNEHVPRKERFRDPDAISGGTWEAFEQILQRAGYFKNGLRKVEVARAFGLCVDPYRQRSDSFQLFRDAILDAL